MLVTRHLVLGIGCHRNIAIMATINCMLHRLKHLRKTGVEIEREKKRESNELRAIYR